MIFAVKVNQNSQFPELHYNWSCRSDFVIFFARHHSFWAVDAITRRRVVLFGALFPIRSHDSDLWRLNGYHLSRLWIHTFQVARFLLGFAYYLHALQDAQLYQSDWTFQQCNVGLCCDI